MNAIKRNLPNAVTSINLLGGVAAIITGCQGQEMIGPLSGTCWAWICIAVAACADFCDGLVARLMHAYSDFGKEFDSLCDNVSFGVAPAVALWFMLSDAGTPLWALWPLLLIPLCGAIRLARFNTVEDNPMFFTGLPIPGNALFWIGYMASVASIPLFAEPIVLISVVVVESWLMVSPLKIFSFKFKSLGWNGNGRRWITIIAAITLLLALRVQSLLWIVVFYIGISQIRATRR